MTVGELMSAGRLLTALPETPVLEAGRRMLERRIRHLLVADTDGSCG